MVKADVLEIPFRYCLKSTPGQEFYAKLRIPLNPLLPGANNFVTNALSICCRIPRYIPSDNALTKAQYERVDITIPKKTMILPGVVVVVRQHDE